MNPYAMPDMWSAQNDPMQDGYGFVPLIAGIALLGTAGWATINAGRTALEATGPNDLARMAQNERDKIDKPLDSIQGDMIRSGMLQGARSTREARYIGSYWLFRTSRVALKQVGGRSAAQRLVSLGDDMYKRGYQMSANTDPKAIAKVFTYVQSEVTPYSFAAAELMEKLGSEYSTALRKSYREQTSITNQLFDPVRQTAIDVGEAGERVGAGVAAPFRLGNWIGENKFWIIGAGAGLIVLNAILTRGKNKSTSTPQPSRRRRRRSA